MEDYDPRVAPDPEEWLAMDYDDRIALIRDYHRRARVKLPKALVHAIMHDVVETQVAMGDEIPVRRNFDRLQDEGLDRHDAIHAVGSVLAEQMFELVKTEEPPQTDPNETYWAALERLTAESWVRDYS